MRTSTLGAATIRRACLCLLIIVCGLALRKFGLGLGLPSVLVKYGGSVVWGRHVVFLFAIVAPGQAPRGGGLGLVLFSGRVGPFFPFSFPGVGGFPRAASGAVFFR